MADELLLCGAALALLAKKRKLNKRKRSKWSKEWLLKRHQLSLGNLLNELRLEPEDWFNYLRMNEETYMDLLQIVTPQIETMDTVTRKAISPHERLSATLRFLSTGRSYADLNGMNFPFIDK
ncbi:hypothetical protein JTB14_007265 [Gonioctena quinquepunctata]|nr:hypothetical protein JTB14_007265 [Gonioctena quinquepunctata]